MSRRVIDLNEETRYIMDGQSVQIELLTTVDPTKAPGFDEDLDDPTPRKEWRNTGKYCSSLPRAIELTLELKLHLGADAPISQVLQEIKAFRAEVREAFGENSIHDLVARVGSVEPVEDDEEEDLLS